MGSSVISLLDLGVCVCVCDLGGNTNADRKARTRHNEICLAVSATVLQLLFMKWKNVIKNKTAK